MVKFIISILVFGIMAFANEREAPDNFVQKVVNASQNAAPSQTGQGIVSILKKHA